MVNRTSRACRVAAVIFGTICVLHVVRLITRTPVVIGAWSVPLSLSGLAGLVSGGLAWWMWRSSGA